MPLSPPPPPLPLIYPNPGSLPATHPSGPVIITAPAKPLVPYTLSILDAEFNTIATFTSSSLDASDAAGSSAGQHIIAVLGPGQTAQADLTASLAKKAVQVK